MNSLRLAAFAFLTCCVSLLSSAQSPESQGLVSPPELNFRTISVGDFTRPVDIVHAGDERLFVVEQPGVIWIMDTAGTVNPTPFMDITDRVKDIFNEQGLLGLAFSPDYDTDGFFYVNYTESDNDTRISRFSVTSDPNVADPASEVLILEMGQPFTNHNGGCIRFGPDGYLYIGTGDGGSFGDPGNRAQNPLDLLGKMLRIDVAGTATYTIPSDNPYAGSTDTLPEIWHTGLRNPWKFAFDSENGNLWMGDVGQNDWEEVNVQLGSSTGGENWGWRCYEGNDNYNISGCSGPSLYDGPVFVYDHISGGFSVTGGEIYRGTQFEAFQGHYVFIDYVTGNDWATRPDYCNDGEWITQPISGSAPTDISTYGQDIYGEMYAANLLTGRIYKIEEQCSKNGIPNIEWYNDLGPLGLQTDEIPGATYSWITLSGGCVEVGTDAILPYATPFSEYFVEVSYPDGCVINSPSSYVPPFDGLHEPGFEAFKLTPNPANNSSVITINNTDLEALTFSIFDLSGRTLQTNSISGGLQDVNHTLDVSELSSGTYWIRVESNTRVQLEQLIVNH